MERIYLYMRRKACESKRRLKFNKVCHTTLFFCNFLSCDGVSYPGLIFQIPHCFTSSVIRSFQDGPRGEGDFR
uniref:U8 n=1 Tax=Human betaherpesvirus 6 TaxID=10368 RepID=A0A5P9VGX6_9BETA|nr:U8 [Human betaherpesvirus 6]QFV47786.1 hypothetical protein [Human betaherpesvirus 6]QFV49794.1 hypothetical protein [Human betaherpesvirus 6]QFX16105.1 hypothetical protein [Human betaherpesvirus 6]QFX43683.1 hypothetical protein [Human betaherpesvirus 6]